MCSCSHLDDKQKITSLRHFAGDLAVVPIRLTFSAGALEIFVMASDEGAAVVVGLTVSAVALEVVVMAHHSRNDAMLSIRLAVAAGVLEILVVADGEGCVIELVAEVVVRIAISAVAVEVFAMTHQLFTFDNLAKIVVVVAVAAAGFELGVVARDLVLRVEVQTKLAVGIASSAVSHIMVVVTNANHGFFLLCV
eukprot:CAMPEP_0197515010 /NCGR_PEP_ID=MMETSP1318-20131121/269_1 /TAXON_ID=552666 /ORGANISM="Partenskyella glossopodia, Strain RCC365" /LENGTH=193 /DNA_ID=CAMNT_0043063257 /DNA_START=244 /DNA_END=825 /DNA_ORIENTATION=+